MSRPRLLVTGFGPFPTVPRNPSAEAARRVAACPRWRLLGIEARALILTTSYATLPCELDPALAETPAAVLMVGVASRAKAIRIERRATDRRSALFPDVRGERAAGATAAGASRARRIGIAPVKLLRIVRRHGLRARISHDAGRYLCNASYFRALGAALPVVFVHIPKEPPSGARRIAGRPQPRSRDRRLADALVEVAILLLRKRRAAY